MSWTREQAEEYDSTLEQFLKETGGRFTRGEMKDILNSLHRYERTLHRLSENACNGWDVTGRGDESKEWRERVEKKVASIEKLVKKIAERLGFGVDFQGDPRGATIRFKLPSKNYNSWDGETWIIGW